MKWGIYHLGGAATTSSFVLNKKGYFLTARDSMKNGGCDRQLWEYEPNSDSWVRKSDFPDSPRQDNTTFTCVGKGYVGETVGCSPADNHFWEYDPLADQWTQVASLPISIQSASTSISVSSDYAFLFGGSDDVANYYNSIWRYNIPLNYWQSMGNMPGLGREYSVLWGLDSILLLGGGVMVDSHSNIYLANDYYKYNYFSNSWTPVVFQNYFDSTAYGAAFVYNKRGYYFGGASSYLQPTISNKMWSFDASKYIHDKPTGISSVTSESTFKLYPNPIKSGQGFAVSASEDGEIGFYDALGRVIDERKFLRGVTQVRLSVDDEVVFYRVSLVGGEVRNGKVVFLR